MAMFTTSILIFALIAVHAQAFALWVQSIRLTNNRISKSNYGDDITDAVPVFLFLRRSFSPDRHPSYDFVPVKRFRWYKVCLLRRFVPRKRFRRYERASKVCFVRGTALSSTCTYRQDFSALCSLDYFFTHISDILKTNGIETGEFYF